MNAYSCSMTTPSKQINRLQYSLLQDWERDAQDDLEKRRKVDPNYRVPDDFNACPATRSTLEAMPLMILPEPGPTVTFVDGVYQVTPEIEAGRKSFFVLHCTRIAIREKRDIREVMAEERAHGNDSMERYMMNKGDC